MNPTALITGASRGIGLGIALELARLGHDLLLNYVRDEAAARRGAEDCLRAAAEAGQCIRVRTHGADVGLEAGRAGLIAAAREQFGDLNLLVNNAGVAPRVRADLLESGEASFDEVLAVNLKGPFFLTQLAARWMIESVERARAAGTAPAAHRVAIVSSISAYTASVNRAEYCVAKAGLSMVARLFAARLAEFGICVHEIRPGIVATDMTEPVRDKYDASIRAGLTPLRRWGTPQDVGLAVAAIARGLLPFRTGGPIDVDGGFHLRRL
jgi:NAD(P)-dependent dehydrogenase (short-subunit alcohol dehydrogenase family)